MGAQPLGWQGDIEALQLEGVPLEDAWDALMQATRGLQAPAASPRPVAPPPHLTSAQISTSTPPQGERVSKSKSPVRGKASKSPVRGKASSARGKTSAAP